MVLTRCSCAVFVVLFANVFASPAQIPEETLNGFKAVTNLYDDCASKDYSMTSCLKLKALTLLDRVARSDNIAFSDTIVISKNADAKSRGDYGRAINENELENEIKTSANNEVVASESDSKLNSLILERVAKFLSSHNVNIKLPNVSKDDLGRALEEMRGKKNKGMGMMMMAIGMKLMMLIPIAIGLLFLLAGKALIISKIALVLALIITIKKLLASKHESHESHGWSSGGGHGGGWDRRSLDAQNAAQDIAYSAYKQ
ncbi:hypothetical protein M8J76_000663 [Diaphorina citri]|nr:hypothetical protein M8J75_014595 [Diaphorina citri]KAI5713499.1 hypothetical protein M8J76_000663 [Diaphorina citri]